jgi:DNA-directed RNA polymerase subunit RPC12/RpoP
MSITFHCVNCGNKITAKDESAGKWGICPACHNKIYIPDLNAEIDDLKLAPVNEEEENKQKKLMAETYKITRDILQERETEAGKGAAFSTTIDDKVLQTRIISYLRKIKDGKLPEAEELENQITCYGQQTLHLLDKIASNDIPEPELADIPRGTLLSLIRNMRGKIS